MGDQMESTQTATQEVSRRSMLYGMSSLKTTAQALDALIPMATNLESQLDAVLADTDSFNTFLDRVEGVVCPVPGLLQWCLVGTILTIVGQIVVLVFVQKYYTVWYYEMTLRKRRQKLRSANNLNAKAGLACTANVTKVA